MKLLRPDQVASMLNVSKRQVYRLVENGHFIALKVGPRGIRITEDSLHRYIDRQIQLFALENGLIEKTVT